jgi:O-glycosyl hydrolase
VGTPAPSSQGIDAAAGSPDTASAHLDAGSTPRDAGPPSDAGSTTTLDAGSTSADAGSTSADAGTLVTIYLDRRRQVIDGFGGSNAWTGLPADTDAKAHVLDLLFSTTRGAGLSIIRNRIPFREQPSNGFDDQFLQKDASGYYLATTANGSKTFSLNWRNWDLAGTRALYEAIKAQGTDYQVAAFLSTPWTPPNNRLSNWKIGVPDPVNYPQIGGSLDPAHYRDCADVLADYANGFPANMANSLTAISIQNEPDWPAQYETCSWTNEQIAAFLPVLRAEFMAKGVPASVKVLAPEDMNFKEDLLDATSVQEVDIVGVHQYDWQSKANYAARPLPLTKAAGKKLWMTEFSTSNGDASIADGLVVASIVHEDLTLAEVNAFLYWWLWTNGTWLSNGSLLNVNGSVVDESKRLYALGQYSRFVRPGWFRVDAATNPLPDVLVSAFEDPASRMTAIVAVNRGGGDATLSLALPAPAKFGSLTTYRTSATESLANLGTAVVNASATRVSLKAQSVTTFVGGVAP